MWTFHGRDQTVINTKVGLLELAKQLGNVSQAAVVDLTMEEPTWGQGRVARELEKRGLPIAPAGVRCVWMRHDSETTAKRLKELGAQVAGGGFVLTAAQVAALENMRADREANGEFASEYPGYCGVLDTFYVGTLKSLGRIYEAARREDECPPDRAPKASPIAAER